VGTKGVCEFGAGPGKEDPLKKNSENEEENKKNHPFNRKSQERGKKDNTLGGRDGGTMAKTQQ